MLLEEQGYYVFTISLSFMRPAPPDLSTKAKREEHARNSRIQPPAYGDRITREGLRQLEMETADRFRVLMVQIFLLQQENMQERS